MIYITLILSHLSYCCEIWENTYNTRLDSLNFITKESSQNTNVVENIGWNEQSTEIFKQYRLLKLLRSG